MTNSCLPVRSATAVGDQDAAQLLVSAPDATRCDGQASHVDEVDCIRVSVSVLLNRDTSNSTHQQARSL